MPRLFAEDTPLNSRALAWTVSAAAGAALASFAGLLGRWSANPILGGAVALAAAGLGTAAASRARVADDDGARAWAAGGALAALAVPALLRVLGLSLADPSLLMNPLGGAYDAAFVLGQAALLAAFAAGAWSRASRGAGSGGAAAALAAAALAASAFRLAEPSLFLAAAGLAVLAAAVLLERPWARRESAPLRARMFAAAAALGLVLATFSPHVLRDAWMARLHAAYPGGEYLTLSDDGTRLWAAYRFSSGAGAILRDGVPQVVDQATSRAALLAVIGQRAGATQLLLVRPPEASLAQTAQADGAFVEIVDVSPAEAAVLDALSGGREWRKRLIPPPPPAAPNAALVFLAASPDSIDGAARRLTALRARLADGAVVGLLLPPGAAPRDVDAAARAAAVFGEARVADLPKGVLVLASRPAVQTDAAQLAANLDKDMIAAVPGLPEILAAAVHFRPAPSAK